MSTEQKQFEIIETIGRGAFGTVYRAEMTGPGGFRKAVAIKVLNENMADTSEFAERLRDEARILGLLNHRAIVRVDGLRQWDGRWAVVMEFVEGVDLKCVLSSGPVPPGPALEIVEEVASALDSAYHATDGTGHPVRLLHRDIKPSNIHLTSRGGVKVLDFGVARADFQARESETRSIFFGSIGYMGPERMDGIDSHAGDVYALGVVLCELLIGETLGRSWSNPVRHETHRVEALKKLWDVCPDRDLYELVGRCLSYEPSHRPSARDLSRALRSIRSRYPEPWLRDWAEAAVTNLMSRAKAPPESVDGTMVADPGAVPSVRHGDTDVAGHAHVSETASGVLQPDVSSEVHVVDVPDRSSFFAQSRMLNLSPMTIAAGAALVALVLVIPTGLGVAWMTLQPQPEERRPIPPTVEPVGDDQAAIDAFVVEEESVVQTAPTDPRPVNEPQKPVVRPSADPNDGSAGVDSVEAPDVPEADRDPSTPDEVAASGRVTVTGDATSVRLIGDGSSYAPGTVPAGSYEVRAVFGSGPLRAAGRVTVPAGGVVTLSCRAGLKRCAER